MLRLSQSFKLKLPLYKASLLKTFKNKFLSSNFIMIPWNKIKLKTLWYKSIHIILSVTWSWVLDKFLKGQSRLQHHGFLTVNHLLFYSVVEVSNLRQEKCIWTKQVQKRSLLQKALWIQNFICIDWKLNIALEIHCTLVSHLYVYFVMFFYMCMQIVVCFLFSCLGHVLRFCSPCIVLFLMIQYFLPIFVGSICIGYFVHA